jgi:hypothetical protein
MWNMLFPVKKKYEGFLLYNRKSLGNRAYKCNEKVIKLLGLLAKTAKSVC